MRRLLPVALVAVAGTGCAATTVHDPFDRANPVTSQIQVYIENRGTTDVRVYSRTSHGSQYLGQVATNTHLSLQLAWSGLEQIGFRLEVLAGRTYTTQSIAVSPGQRVELYIPDNPSNAIVRRGD